MNFKDCLDGLQRDPLRDFIGDAELLETSGGTWAINWVRNKHSNYIERNSMLYTPLKVAGAYEISVEKFEDARGFFARVFNHRSVGYGFAPQIVQVNNLTIGIKER